MPGSGWADAPLLAPPPAGLEGWVSAGIAVQLDAPPGASMLSRFPAGASSAIVVTLQGRFSAAQGAGSATLPKVFVSGPSTRPVTLSHMGVLRCAGVMVRPSAAAALLGAPGRLVDRIEEASATLGADGHAIDVALHGASPAEAIDALYALVRRRASEPARQAQRLAALRLQQDCLAGVREAARLNACSPRQVERRFVSVFGLPPKRFQRLARAEAAMRVALAAGRCDAELALSLGYFDQSHLGRDLRELAGLAPGQLARMPDASDPSWWPLRIGASYPQHGIRADFGVGDTSLFS